MGEYAAFLLILVFGFACGYGTARARGIKQPESELPSIEKIRIEQGDTVLIRYEGFLTNLQRAALKDMINQRFRDKAEQVVLLEAGLEVEVVKGVRSLTPEPDAFGSTEVRRRDDNRAQRAPEEPWQ